MDGWTKDLLEKLQPTWRRPFRDVWSTSPPGTQPLPFSYLCSVLPFKGWWLQGWKNASGVKNSYCSCRGLGSYSQQQHGCSQLSTTPILCVRTMCDHSTRKGHQISQRWSYRYFAGCLAGDIVPGIETLVFIIVQQVSLTTEASLIQGVSHWMERAPSSLRLAGQWAPEVLSSQLSLRSQESWVHHFALLSLLGSGDLTQVLSKGFTGGAIALPTVFPLPFLLFLFFVLG